MISNRARGLMVMHWLLQSCAVLGLFWLWVYLSLDVLHDTNLLLQQYVTYSVVLATACLVDLGRSKLARKDLLHLNFLRNHKLTLRQTIVILGTLLIFLVGAKDLQMSRLFLFTFAPAVYLVLLITNAILPRPLAAWLFSGNNRANTLLVGSSSNAVRLKPWLERKTIFGFNPIGLITDEDRLNVRCDLPVLGNLRDIGAILQSSEATQLIAVDLPLSPTQIIDLGDLCDKHGVRLLIVNNLEDQLHRSISFFEDDGFNFIGFRQEPLECPFGRAMKRVLDLAVALPMVLLVLPPVCLTVAVLQRMQSPGPLFFRQRRTGKYNRQFLIFKFRTMHMNDEEGRQATAHDHRIFSAGKWLRKFSVDELPQFINVLTGEMSVVGPRPHFVDHDLLFGEIANFYRVRSFIKPGITGLAQVRGLRGEARREQDLVDRIHSDLYYLEHWSPIMDWMIIFRTAWQMIQPPQDGLLTEGQCQPMP